MWSLVQRGLGSLAGGVASPLRGGTATALWKSVRAWSHRFPAAAVTNNHTQWPRHHTLTVLMIPQSGSSEVQNQSVGRAVPSGGSGRSHAPWPWPHVLSLPLTPAAVKPLRYAGPPRIPDNLPVSRSSACQVSQVPVSTPVTHPQVLRTRTGTVLILLSAALSQSQA